MHGEGCGGGGFAVEVAGGGEVVEGGFEGDFVVGSGWGLTLVKRWLEKEEGGGLTLCSAVGLRGQECSFRFRRAGPRFRWLHLFGDSCR